MKQCVLFCNCTVSLRFLSLSIGRDLFFSSKVILSCFAAHAVRYNQATYLKWTVDSSGSFTVSVPYLLHCLTTKSVSGDLFDAVEFGEVNENIMPRCIVTGWLHTTVTSENMHETTNGAQWLQPNPHINGKLLNISMPHTMIYFIYINSSGPNTAKLSVNTI